MTRRFEYIANVFTYIRVGLIRGWTTSHNRVAKFLFKKTNKKKTHAVTRAPTTLNVW